MLQPRRGFTLIEVALATVVGLALMAGSVYAFNQMQQSAKFSQAKSMVQTLQTNIGMEKFRAGVAPPVTPNPSASATLVPCLSNNIDGASKPYWSGNPTGPGNFPADPVTGNNTILPFDSTQTPGPLASGDPNSAWDNPIFTSTAPAASPGYGNGGWLYDANTGSFRINLSNKGYPDQHPGTW